MALSVSNHRLAPAIRFVSSPNIGGAMAPKLLVIHYTASDPGFDTAAYFAKPAARASAHLVIRRDGTIIQCVPFNAVAWHAGKSRWTGADGRVYSNLNRNAVGIEIENWGPLKKTGNGWVSWSGQPVPDALAVEACHKFGTPDCGWERFTQSQVGATVEVARAICAVYGIAEIVGHDDIAPGRKSDPGPAWDMETFRAGVLAANKRVA